jgi:hypothetical protein
MTPQQAQAQLERLVQALTRSRLVGAAWTDDATPSQVVVMAVSAGGAFTEAARAHTHAPSAPVDMFARRCVVRDLLPALGRLGHVARWALPTGEGYDAAGGPLPRVNFTKLARAGGLGAPSRLGILLNPSYGLWWAMRFAAWVEVDDAARAALAASPLWRAPTHTHPTPPADALAAACARCAAPCLRACPGLRPAGPAPLPGDAGALPATLPLHACLTHLLAGGCADICHARAACPEGQAWAYGEATHAHHHSALRRMVCGETHGDRSL